MKARKIIVKAPYSCSLGWGIFGFESLSYWEDLYLYDENDVFIGGLCLNAKKCVKYDLDVTNKTKMEHKDFDFINAAEAFLKDNKTYYRYFYDEIGSHDFYEVEFDAPKNEKGVKPRFIDIWHQDDGIEISTIENATKEYLEKFMGWENCVVEVEFTDTLESAFEEFIKYKKVDEIEFSDEVISKLATLWNIEKSDFQRCLLEKYG